MKTKAFSMLIGFFLVGSMLIFPILSSASSFGYSYNLNYRIVNGKSNGQFHHLTSGNASISGDNHVTSQEPGITYPPNDLTFCLHRDDFLRDTEYGCVTANISEYGSTHFSGSFGQVPTSDNFYLVIFKGADDGYNEAGTGSISS